MSTYKVILRKIKLFGFHGVLAEEKEKGQDFKIDIEYNFKKESLKDDLKKTLDYGQVYRETKKIFQKKQYELLENLVDDIAHALMARFGEIKELRVTASKNKPQVEGHVESVSVSTDIKR